MRTVSLNGTWKLYYFPVNEFPITQPEQLSSTFCRAIDAIVPGNVELDLVRTGELPDLFFGDNIHLLKPYELYEWWYEREFETPDGVEGTRVDLTFHGVDCLATYWLNGHQIGTSDNMFVEHSFDVTELLRRDGMNVVTVWLKSPILAAVSKQYEPSFATVNSTTNWPSLWIRKAAHSYSWDIMPRAISAGLWRDVTMVIRERHEITDIYFYTTGLGEHNAHIRGYFELKTDPSYLTDISLDIQGVCGDSSFHYHQEVFFTNGTFVFEVMDPKLWWPRGYGEAHLYDVTTQLKHRETVLAERQDKVGIRKAELIRTDTTSTQSPGQFLFKINDVPIWVKGSNWVPADAFHSRDAQRYEPILKLFRDLNCNMVRCWGGNVYEDHAFYEYCDRHGMMVWQDFAFACANYPQEEQFLASVRSEAESVVRKLRRHASIVLWSGDNECDETIVNRGMDPANNRITREILPQVVARCDPARAYLPSSPYYTSEVVETKNPSLMPEQHLWGPRDYYKSRYYTETTAHFISEIGYHGCPNLSSIQKFIDQDHLWPWHDNEQWVTHASCSMGIQGPNARRIKLMADQIKEMFGTDPAELQDFIIASQISQAEAKKFFIEMVRLKKPRRTGVLWWNVMDGWPQFSDAVVDYYFGKKLAYHYIKRVQQPVCIMFDEPGNWHVRVVAGNDTNADAAGRFRIWDGDSDKTLLEGEFETKANANKEIGKIPVSNGEQRLFLARWEIGGIDYGNHYLLGTPPFSFNKYKQYLEKISELSESFRYIEIGK